MKSCRTCGEEKDESLFYKAKTTKDGLRTECKDCSKAERKALYNADIENARAIRAAYRDGHRSENAARSKDWYEKNRERVRARSAAYRSERSREIYEKNRKWATENRDRVRDLQRRHYKANLEKIKERAKRARASNPDGYREKVAEWRRNNRHKATHYSRKYQLSKERRTPPCLLEEDLWFIEEAYELAKMRGDISGFKWEVDHIIPLNGKIVSGLHVPWNLQVIPKSVNASKSNKFEG